MTYNLASLFIVMYVYTHIDAYTFHYIYMGIYISYIYYFHSIFFPIMLYYKILNIVPCAMW